MPSDSPSTSANAAQLIDEDNYKSTTQTTSSSSAVDDEKRENVPTLRSEERGVEDTEVLDEKYGSKDQDVESRREEKGDIVVKDSSNENEEKIDGNEEMANRTGEDEDDVIELVYPGGLQLALLTLGLCLATFTVALGELFFIFFASIGAVRMIL